MTLIIASSIHYDKELNCWFFASSMLNTQNKKIEKVMVGHEKDAHLDKKKKMIIKITQDVRGKT